MLETTRELGHAIGATASATALSMFIPAFVNDLTQAEAQAHYFEGFRVSTMMVMGVLLAGAVIAYFHKSRPRAGLASGPRAAGASASVTS